MWKVQCVLGMGVLLLAITGCGVEGTSADLPAETFVSTVEMERLATLVVRDRAADPTLPGFVMDATGGNDVFPIQQELRSFTTRAELMQFAAATFGGIELIENDAGEVDGVRGSYLQRGTSYFENRRTGIRYRVTEPVLAYLGGAKGLVRIGGEKVCIDPDGDCSQGYASYLEPDGETTAPTHTNVCGAGVCVQFHSFFNKTWFPFPYARHGSNVRFIAGAPLASTSMRASGRIHYRTGLPIPEFDDWPMPLEITNGQSSVETAVWCIGTTACPEYQAEAVCGWGRITDPRINAERETGNGPLNSAFCGS